MKRCQMRTRSAGRQLTTEPPALSDEAKRQNEITIVGARKDVIHTQTNVDMQGFARSTEDLKGKENAKNESNHQTADPRNTGTPVSSPTVTSEKAEADRVGKLDSSAYQIFGSMVSLSRSSSDTSSSSSEVAICKGGPGKFHCGEQVVNGEKAVQCDKCKVWFHAQCQDIPKPAHDALVKYKCLSWLCASCKNTIHKIKSKDSGINTNACLKSLEEKVEAIGKSVREHMVVIVQSLKEQEQIVNDTSRILERSYRDQHAQKASYAEMVRGTCDKVVQEVNAKIDGLPTKAVTKNGTETVKVMTEVFDSYMDKERRKLNLVVYNLPEPDASIPNKNECDQALFKEMIKDGLKLIVQPTRSFRVGRKLEGRPRLLIVTVENIDIKIDILKLASQLRHLDRWRNVFINPDLSKKEREEGKLLRDKLAARRLAGEKDLTIRNGKIIKMTPENSMGLRQARDDQLAYRAEAEEADDPAANQAGSCPTGNQAIKPVQQGQQK